jgi:N-acetylmuramoyl-L-alanine amidase
VSLYLREFLTKAGAVVFMSRDKDTTVDLKDRSILANKSGADIFISVHHNAYSKDEDDMTNYTSTYYHAKESNYEYEPMNRDLARYVQRDLAYAMRNSGGPGSFDGTYSDYTVHPRAGFSVLRLTEIPAILIECGFHTHPQQEQKIAIEEFNKIEAFGIFKGLCRYFGNGVPKISYINQIKKDSTLILNYSIQDKFGIDSNSIKVYIDSSVVNNFVYDSQKSILQVGLNEIQAEHSIRIIAANKNGNHAYPFQHKIKN